MHCGLHSQALKKASSEARETTSVFQRVLCVPLFPEILPVFSNVFPLFPNVFTKFYLVGSSPFTLAAFLEGLVSKFASVPGFRPSRCSLSRRDFFMIYGICGVF